MGISEPMWDVQTVVSVWKPSLEWAWRSNWRYSIREFASLQTPIYMFNGTGDHVVKTLEEVRFILDLEIEIYGN